jgi:hypothetical protein
MSIPSEGRFEPGGDVRPGKGAAGKAAFGAHCSTSPAQKTTHGQSRRKVLDRPRRGALNDL